MKKAIKICLAEQQTMGKARLSREWYSPFGKNIYMSCLYPFQKDVSELAGLSLVVTLAIIKTLNGYGIADHLFAKWPNDVVYENIKKISGSLIEIQAESHGACQAIIGIGLNVNMLGDDQSISQPWTSMRKILGEYLDRNEVCSRLINELITYLHQFNQRGFASFVEEWMQSDCLLNQSITLKNMDDKIQGKVVGINEHGHLLLRLMDGTLRTFSSGDTSISRFL